MGISSIGTSSYSDYLLNQTNNSQTSRAQKLLEEMDSDQDSSVSKTEFTSFNEKMKELGANAPPPPPPTNSSTDTSSSTSGSSTSDTSSTSSSTTASTNSFDTLFSSLDTDGSGSLSVDELSSMVAQAQTQGAAPPPPPPPPSQTSDSSSSSTSTSSSSSSTSILSTSSSTSTDSTSSSDEAALIQQLFAAADTDGNGSLSQQELLNLFNQQNSNVSSSGTT